MSSASVILVLSTAAFIGGGLLLAVFALMGPPRESKATEIMDRVRREAE